MSKHTVTSYYEPCECYVHVDSDPTKTGIKFCPLHEAAPDLLRVAKAFMRVIDAYDITTSSYCELCDSRAPRDSDGVIADDIHHREDCGYRIAKDAIAKVGGQSK